MTTNTKTHQEVQKHYAEFARTASNSCCSPQNKLYPVEALKDLPADIADFTAGSGDPITPAKLQPGETVLDLGSGGGLDCFLAARQVGPEGRVIGVDMTPEMVARARQSAERLGLKNVEFREGYLEALPVDSGTVDAVISNCVINLAPDKQEILGEVFRVLKPGGRFMVSDIVTNRPVPESRKKNRDDWCGCTSGALPIGEYRDVLRKAGFVDIQFTPDTRSVEQALESGQARLPEGINNEDVRRDIANFEHCERGLFVPHMISAYKPA
jgi:SAM-dependent methyltransferase